MGLGKRKILHNTISSNNYFVIICSIMKMKGVKKIRFWTRELNLPLFWLTDKNLEVFSSDALTVYKKPIIHVYHLNDKSEKGSYKTYKFFSKKENVTLHKRQCLEIFKKIEDISSEWKNLKIRNLSDKEMTDKLIQIFKILNLFAKIYSRIEPIYLQKIEQDQNKFKKVVKVLGELRLKLRRESEIIFYLFLGIMAKELARRNGLKMSELYLYTNEEFFNLVFKKKKVHNRIVEERAKGYVCVALNGKYKIYTGAIYKKIYDKLVSSAKKVKELKGMPAMRGKVKGMVRLIIHNKKNISRDVEKFKKGEILVTEMTRPGTIMACRRAAAIITDEGGITSHAAIISRELKIPCIIGTHNATQALKTGDMVEVDANKGIIKIIKGYGS